VKAGNQLIEQPPRSGTEPGYCPLRLLFVWLHSRLHGNDEPWNYLGLSVALRKIIREEINHGQNR
jgi:hypothetical protein